MTIISKKNLYLQRKKRTNTAIKKTLPSFRCVVVKSNKHIRAQVLDLQGNVIVSFCDSNKNLTELKITKVQSSAIVGDLVGKKLLDMGIQSCVFDRNGHIYHGRIKSLCDAIRNTGITI